MLGVGRRGQQIQRLSQAFQIREGQHHHRLVTVPGDDELGAIGFDPIKVPVIQVAQSNVFHPRVLAHGPPAHTIARDDGPALFV